jgi:hypothetical protein
MEIFNEIEDRDVEIITEKEKRGTVVEARHCPRTVLCCPRKHCQAVTVPKKDI